MIILDRHQIEDLIDLPAAADAIRDAFCSTSRGEVNLPPVGHITFPQVSGDCHIKYGHMQGKPDFVIKVATGFPQNAETEGGTGNGMSLVLSATTGAVQAILHDEMVMTDMRTGLAGAIATQALARPDSRTVLVVGTGPQAMRQIESHAAVMGDHLRFEVWGRSASKAAQLVNKLGGRFAVRSVSDLEAAVRRADVIVTATGSTTPLIQSDWVSAGAHITAVGADAPGKQELDVHLVARADLRVVDLAAQCLDHGEMSHAAAQGLIAGQDVLELGQVLLQTTSGRENPDHITIADLTGIAAQDIAIADMVLKAYRAKGGQDV